MDLSISFGEAAWLVAIGLIFVAYLVMLFFVLVDALRDRTVPVWGRALWVVALVVAPVVGLLTYLVVRGDGIDARRAPA